MMVRVCKNEPLNAVREIELFAKMPATREFLIRNNMPLAMSAAKRYANAAYPLDDVFQDACAVLIHAVDRFDITKGFRFSTFYWSCVWKRLYKQKAIEEMYFDHVPLTEILWPRVDDPAPREDINLGCLDAQERRVIKARFWKYRTLREIGSEEGVSKQRVQQVNAKAIRKLRDALGK